MKKATTATFTRPAPAELRRRAEELRKTPEATTEALEASQRLEQIAEELEKAEKLSELLTEATEKNIATIAEKLGGIYPTTAEALEASQRAELESRKARVEELRKAGKKAEAEKLEKKPTARALKLAGSPIISAACIAVSVELRALSERGEAPEAIQARRAELPQALKILTTQNNRYGHSGTITRANPRASLEELRSREEFASIIDIEAEAIAVYSASRFYLRRLERLSRLFRSGKISEEAYKKRLAKYEAEKLPKLLTEEVREARKKLGTHYLQTCDKMPDVMDYINEAIKIICEELRKFEPEAEELEAVAEKLDLFRHSTGQSEKLYKAESFSPIYSEETPRKIKAIRNNNSGEIIFDNFGLRSFEIYTPEEPEIIKYRIRTKRKAGRREQISTITAETYNNLDKEALEELKRNFTIESVKVKPATYYKAINDISIFYRAKEAVAALIKKSNRRSSELLKLENYGKEEAEELAELAKDAEEIKAGVVNRSNISNPTAEALEREKSGELERLKSFLSPQDVKIVSGFVSGLSASDIARKEACNRSTICRRKKAIEKVIFDIDFSEIVTTEARKAEELEKAKARREEAEAAKLRKVAELEKIKEVEELCRRAEAEKLDALWDKFRHNQIARAARIAELREEARATARARAEITNRSIIRSIGTEHKARRACKAYNGKLEVEREKHNFAYHYNPEEARAEAEARKASELEKLEAEKARRAEELRKAREEAEAEVYTASELEKPEKLSKLREAEKLEKLFYMPVLNYFTWEKAEEEAEAEELRRLRKLGSLSIKKEKAEAEARKASEELESLQKLFATSEATTEAKKILAREELEKDEKTRKACEAREELRKAQEELLKAREELEKLSVYGFTKINI